MRSRAGPPHEDRRVVERPERRPGRCLRRRPRLAGTDGDQRAAWRAGRRRSFLRRPDRAHPVGARPRPCPRGPARRRDGHGDGHRERLPAVAGHRQGGSERALGCPAHRLADRHQERDSAGRRGVRLLGEEWAEGEWVQNEAGEMVWQPAEGGTAVSATEWSQGAEATDGAVEEAVVEAVVEAVEEVVEAIEEVVEAVESAVEEAVEEAAFEEACSRGGRRGHRRRRGHGPGDGEGGGGDHGGRRRGRFGIVSERTCIGCRAGAPGRGARPGHAGPVRGARRRTERAWSRCLAVQGLARVRRGGHPPSSLRACTAPPGRPIRSRSAPGPGASGGREGIRLGGTEPLMCEDRSPSAPVRGSTALKEGRQGSCRRRSVSTSSLTSSG